MSDKKSISEIIEEVNACSNLAELFELWKDAHNSEEDYEVNYNNAVSSCDKIEKDSFVKDGYINEEKYKACNKKVLFILKEANISEHRGLEPPCEREQINWYENVICGKSKDDKDNKPKQIEKLGRMAYYLQKGKSAEALRVDKATWGEALRSAAFMNLNKRGGGKKIDGKYKKIFNEYTTVKYKPFILKQIEILNPDIIVVIGDTEAGKHILIEYAEKSIKTRHPAYPFRKSYFQEIKEVSKAGTSVEAHLYYFFTQCKDLNV